MCMENVSRITKTRTDTTAYKIVRRRKGSSYFISQWEPGFRKRLSWSLLNLLGGVGSGMHRNWIERRGVVKRYKLNCAVTSSFDVSPGLFAFTNYRVAKQEAAYAARFAPSLRVGDSVAVLECVVPKGTKRTTGTYEWRGSKKCVAVETLIPVNKLAEYVTGRDTTIPPPLKTDHDAWLS